MNDTQRADLKAILWGGLVAGTVDIFAASLITLLSPLLIMRFIAAGLLGREVIQGGLDISAGEKHARACLVHRVLVVPAEIGRCSLRLREQFVRGAPQRRVIGLACAFACDPACVGGK